MVGVKASEGDLSHVPLQAIILADSFTPNYTKLRPITLEWPKVLLPLVNTPMIDYTLAWLESTAAVAQVFVLCCCSHDSNQIINYLDKSKWVNKPNFSVTAIECESAGDALRLIYERNVIQGDFILVSGDIVSNMMLTQALEEHKQRRIKDKNAVMTMVIKQSSEACRDELIMGIDPTTKELVYYEEDKAGEDLKFDKSFLSVNPCLSLHNDKQDCYIDICSPQVLGLLFTVDNFDYQHLRRQFVKGLLVDDHLMDFKIFTHEIHSSSCCAARIDNFRSYEAISKDILHQFSITKSGHTCYITQSQVGPFTYIGKDTIIGNKTIISNSVVGDGCKIGSNVAIDGCYIWNNVIIQDGCKLRHAILCDGAVMKSGAVLEPGVVLSYKVVVGQNSVVPRNSKVSLLPQPPVKQDSDRGLEYGVLTLNINGDGCVVSDMGEDGCGYIWPISSEVDHEEEWRPIPESGYLDSDTESYEERLEKEVKDLISYAVEKNAQVDQIIPHMRSRQSACTNMGRQKCAAALLCLIMKLALDTSNNSGNSLVKETNHVISKYKEVLQLFLRGVNEKIKMISKFEEMCLESAKEYAPLFVQVLYILYNKNIIQKDAILGWANHKQRADESDKDLFKQSEKFIRWLKKEDQDFPETDLKRLNEGGVKVKKMRLRNEGGVQVKKRRQKKRRLRS